MRDKKLLVWLKAQLRLEHNSGGCEGQKDCVHLLASSKKELGSVGRAPVEKTGLSLQFNC